MIGILIATHGAFAQGIVNGMELICGPQENLRTLHLALEDDIEVFGEQIKKAAGEMNDGDGVLVFVDFLGGSPANVVSKFILSMPNVEGIAGINFPMLLEAVSARESMSLNELKNLCCMVGKDGIIDIKKKLGELMEED